MFCWTVEFGVDAGSLKITILSKLIVESEFWFWLALFNKPDVDKVFVGANNSTGGWSIGFDGSSSSSNMHKGGWLGIWEILQCNKLLSISDDFGGNVTENEDVDTKDGGVGGAGGDSCCWWDTFWRQEPDELLFPPPILTAVEDTLVPCNADCNWLNGWNLCCCCCVDDDDEFGKCG